MFPKLQASFLFLFLLLSTFSFAQSSKEMDLLGRWYEDSIICNSTRVRFSDCYGFVFGGKEYAVVGSTEGTHVFEISASNEFIPKGFVKGRYSNVQVQHREYATCGNYLYAVCDEGVSSLQIIDFSYLPDSIHLAKEDTLHFGRVHNIRIDTLNKTLYSCIHRSTTSTQIIASPMKVFSIADPLNPVELWAGPDDIPEVHDVYVRDGKAFLNCGFDGLRLYSFSPDPSNPVYLESKTFYQDQGYNHQGWLSPSGETYVFADETNGMRVKKCSVTGNTIDLDQFFGTNYESGSVPHNIMCTDTFAYVAYYNEGFRVFDLRKSPPLEIAYFDTYPEENFFQQNGNWGVYSLFPSGRILVSDRQYGLFLLNFDRNIFDVEVDGSVFSVYPNPVRKGQELIVRIPDNLSSSEWKLIDQTGRLVREGSVNESYFFISADFASGVYNLRFSYLDYLDDRKYEMIKVVVE